MKPVPLAALAALLGGLALIAYGITTGEVRVGLFAIVPYVYATGIAGSLGILLCVAAVALWVFSRAPRLAPPDADAPAESEGTTRHGGVILLGPIPIVWGSDRRILPWMMAGGVALLVLAIGLTWARR